jgi:thiol-disulfide isomerase/thioredoxin
MKHILRNLLILTVFPIFAHAQTGVKPPAKKPASLDLKVRVKGLTKGTCLLANHYGDQQFIQDSAKVDATGLIEFKDSAAMDGGIYLVVLPNKKYFEIVLTDEQRFSVETDTADFVKNMKVTGNKENQYFYEYLNYLADQQKKIEPYQNLLKVTHSKDSIAMLQKKTAAVDSVVKQYKRDYYKKTHPETFMAKVLSAMDEPDNIPYSQCPKKADGTIDSTYNYWNFRRHYWDGMDFTDDRLVRTPVYSGKMKFYLNNLASQDPDSLMKACDWLIEKTRPSKELFKYTVYYCTYNYETSKIMGYDAIFVHLVDKYYKTNQAFWLTPEQKTKIINRADQLSYSLIGKTAVNISLNDTAGKLQNLQDVKAKYTVVIFWDPTCSHCKKEVPILKAYGDSLNKIGVSFKVFAVVSELDTHAWKEFIKTNNLNWINVAAKEEKELANLKYYYDVYSTPTIYLLDEKKTIIGKRLDADGLKGFLDHLLTTSATASIQKKTN